MRKDCVAWNIPDQIIGQADLTTSVKFPKAHLISPQKVPERLDYRCNRTGLEVRDRRK